MKLLLMAAIAAAWGCAPAGISYQCTADPTMWHGEYCEVRSHHQFRSSSVAAYLVRANGEVVALYPYESSSVFQPMTDILSAIVP